MISALKKTKKKKMNLLFLAKIQWSITSNFHGHFFGTLETRPAQNVIGHIERLRSRTCKGHIQTTCYYYEDKLKGIRLINFKTSAVVHKLPLRSPNNLDCWNILLIIRTAIFKIVQFRHSRRKFFVTQYYYHIFVCFWQTW